MLIGAVSSEAGPWDWCGARRIRRRRPQHRELFFSSRRGLLCTLILSALLLMAALALAGRGSGRYVWMAFAGHLRLVPHSGVLRRAHLHAGPQVLPAQEGGPGRDGPADRAAQPQGPDGGAGEVRHQRRRPRQAHPRGGRGPGEPEPRQLRVRPDGRGRRPAGRGRPGAHQVAGQLHRRPPGRGRVPGADAGRHGRGRRGAGRRAARGHRRL